MPMPGSSPRTMPPSSNSWSTSQPDGEVEVLHLEGRDGWAPRRRRARAGWRGTPTGLTGRSRPCASVATRRKWVMPQTLPACTMSTRVGVEQRPVLLEPGEVLAGGDGGPDCPAHGGAARRRPSGAPAPRSRSGRRRSSSAGDVAHGLRAVPRLVGVEHERGPARVAAEHVAHDAQPAAGRGPGPGRP